MLMARPWEAPTPARPQPRRTGLRLAFALAVAACAAHSGSSSSPPPAEDRPTVVVVVGAPGETEFGAQFESWAADWKKAAERSKAKWIAVGVDPAGPKEDHELLRGILAEESKNTTNQLWLVLMGHGTFDRKVAKFNLRGPDLSTAELKDWLKDVKRPLAVINTASASGPFLAELSGPGRVVVTATRSG